jgi:hypothetical protein
MVFIGDEFIAGKYTSGYAAQEGPGRALVTAYRRFVTLAWSAPVRHGTLAAGFDHPT